MVCIQGFVDQAHMRKVLCGAHGNKPVVVLTLIPSGRYQSKKLFPESLPGFILEGGVSFPLQKKFK